jgi:hypothetical protein
MRLSRVRHMALCALEIGNKLLSAARVTQPNKVLDRGVESAAIVRAHHESFVSEEHVLDVGHRASALAQLGNEGFKDPGQQAHGYHAIQPPRGAAVRDLRDLLWRPIVGQVLHLHMAETCSTLSL